MDASNQGYVMPVLVDTNVLIDVLTDDPQWANWSIQQLEAQSSVGLMINPIVYTELCFEQQDYDKRWSVFRRI